MENKNPDFFTISEARRETGLPLVVIRKLVALGELEAQRAIDGTIHVAKTDVLATKEIIKHPWKKAKIFFRVLGPGLITGASDDDPSGIGTYSSVGAKFGFAIIWMAVWLLPVMLAVQEICARIGVVTNRGLAGVIRKHYKRSTVAAIVGLLIIANVVNIGADLGAMAASLVMLTKINFYVALIIFPLIIILVEVFVKYHIYAKVLKWLAFSLVAYIITGILANPDWRLIWRDIVIPQIEFDKEYIFAMMAVFGTTITPYLFFWQTSEEVEEGKCLKPCLRIRLVHGRIRRMRTDVKTGMIFANLVFFFIVLTTAQVLFKNGITEINSAEEAALALRPFAGDFSYLLFAVGIIGAGLLAVPVLAGSGAYALSELMKWKEGMEMKLSKTKNFHLVIAFSIIFGLALNFLSINPIKALYWAAFINGIIAVPLLIAILTVGNDKKIMGEETTSFPVNFFGWLGVLAMIMAIIMMIIFYLV